MQTLVIRFSSLGDIVLAGSVTGALAPVTFLTHSRYADLAAALPGVTQVIRWGEDAIEGPFSRIVDLHGVGDFFLLFRRHCPGSPSIRIGF